MTGHQLPSHSGRCFETYHVAHLVRDVLQPSLKGLYLGNHLGKLPADDSLREERLAEDVTLRRPLEALLDNSSGASDRGTAHHPAERSVARNGIILSRCVPLMLYCQLAPHVNTQTRTLKLERMTSNPPSSGPSMFSAGTTTLSKVM